MALIKAKYRGLDDNANVYQLIHSSESSTAVAQVDIDSTYVNSTYDTYYLIYRSQPAEDDRRLYLRYFVNGSLKSGSSDYFRMNTNHSNTTGYGRQINNSTSFIELIGQSGQGYLDKERGTWHLWFTNVTSTDDACKTFSQAQFKNNGYELRSERGMGELRDDTNPAVNGFRFYYSSGNTAYHKYELYGIKT